MSAEEYTMLAYLLAGGLLWGYALVLWVSGKGLRKSGGDGAH